MLLGQAHGNRDSPAYRDREHVAVVVIGVFANQVDPTRRKRDYVWVSAVGLSKEVANSNVWHSPVYPIARW